MTDLQPPRRYSAAAPAAAPTLERLLRDEAALLRVVRTFSPAGLRFEGEIDLCTRGLLATTLDEAVRFGRADLHVDLSGVTFIDVAGIRTMTTVAKNLSREGRCLLLHATPPLARKVMHILGWDTTPGLRHCVHATL
ncbi:STAS domain-containing protein [Streptomyces sp. NPDC058691]|uniref:STAS domain-containing protein n=1 Tax=Streptomyces sp. NPDC058691 TaxID=3346601 RepID=UPI003659A92F